MPRDARHELLGEWPDQGFDQNALADFGKGRRDEQLCSDISVIPLGLPFCTLVVEPFVRASQHFRSLHGITVAR